jgi:RNA polymerase sigma factor (sigma-70 family)
MSDAVALGRAGSPRLPGQALRVLNDEKLAAMVAGGRDDAFAALYQRHHQAVYRYCVSLLRQEADARDALQNSMLAALSALRANPIEGSFKPWLFRIAHNESISMIRRRGREAPTESPPETATSDDPEAREEVRTLVSDLAALPERQRGAIVMRELSGLSFAEIGAALATSEAGGKQLVYEARTAMHELREGHEMSCELVRERLSAGDRRVLRGRKLRSHLRTCQPCRDFERGIGRRRAAFAALAPPLPAFAAAAVLQDVFGGGGTSGGAGLGGGVASGTGGMAVGGAPLAGTAALKVAAAAVLAGATAVGAYEAGSAIFSGSSASSAVALAEEDASAGPGADRAEQGPGDGTGRSAADGAAKRGSEGSGAQGEAGRGGASGASKPGDSPGSGGPAGSGEGSGPGSTGSSSTGGGSTGGGSTGGGSTGGGGSGDPPTPPTPPPDPPPPPPGGGSGVPPGTPPGHGGTPPGHGGTPPGQAGGGTPPGHLGNPGGGRP